MAQVFRAKLVQGRPERAHWPKRIPNMCSSCSEACHTRGDFFREDPKISVDPVTCVKNQAISAPVLVDVRYATVRADVARLEDVYEQHGARLWRTVFLYAGDWEIASDAVAEAFAQALRGATGSNRPSAGYGEPRFESLLLALPRLTPKQQVAIVLPYYAGYSLKEVAKITHSTPSAVGVHLHRGRRRLRELLGDDDA
jgi:DNA-directed RNA polymerase specialized sigma24 family protein